MSKKKFIYILSILLMVGIISIVSNAKATNPEHIDLKYDTNTNTLSVYIIHGVTFPEDHYVNHIKIEVGEIDGDLGHLTLEELAHHYNIIGTTVVDEDIPRPQQTYNIIHYSYTVIATEGNTPGDTPPIGDAILVTVTCSLGGEYKKYAVLYPISKTHEFGFADVPLPVIMSTILVILIILIPRLVVKDKEIRVTK